MDTVAFHESLRTVVKRGLAARHPEIGLRDEKRKELRGTEHADEPSVRALHRKGGFAARLKRLQGLHERKRGVDHRHGGVHQVLDAHVHVAAHADRLQLEVVEYPAGARGEPPRANRLDVREPHAPPEIGKRKGAHHRIDVGVPMAADPGLHQAPAPETEPMILTIGRNIAMTIVPTTTARTMIRAGSIAAVMPATALSTSSS